MSDARGRSLIRAAVAAMSGYTPGEQPDDPAVIKLNTNENPYPPSPAVLAALRDFDAARLRLYPDPLCRRLREAIARLHGCAVEQVFAGNGSDEILALATRAFVEDDGAIGCFEPSYSLYPVLAAIRGVRVIAVPLDRDYGWRRPPDDVGALFLLATPNAPTSLLPPRAEIERFCAAYRGVVLLDEAYADFAPDQFVDQALTRPNVLVMRTLSKSYSLAGLRVGYAIGHPDLIAALHKIKDSYNLDALAQTLATAAIEDAATMRAQAARIIATRERAVAFLRSVGWTVYPSATNFLWTRPAGLSAADVFAGLRRHKVLVRYFPGPRTGDCLRVTIGTDDQMAAFENAIRSLIVECSKTRFL